MTRTGRRVLAALVILSIGWSTLTGCSDDDDLPDPPWRDGDRIVPAPTTDPQVASQVRSRQWYQAWVGREPLGRSEPGEQVSAEAAFDQNFIHAGAGYRAGLSVFRFGSGDPDHPEIDVRLAEFDHPEQAQAQLRSWASKNPKAVSEPITLDRASRARAYSAPTGTTPCTVDDGQPIDIMLRFLVAGRVAAEVEERCVSSAARESVESELAAKAARIAQLADETAATPLPAAWFDRAKDHHILSNGSWAQDQYVIAGRTDGLDLDRVVPEPFRGTGVQLEFATVDIVLVYPDPTSASRALVRLTTDDSGWRRNQYGPPRASGPNDDADEQFCAEGVHVQEGRTCWSRVGRYLDIATSDDKTHDPETDQLKALRG